MSAPSRWRRGAGRECWESDLGTAYTRDRPPEHEPLTADEVQTLPDGTRILVLWGGGNGPHEYEWRDDLTFVVGDDRDWGSPLGGLIGCWSLVGAEPWQDKVWLAEQ